MSSQVTVYNPMGNAITDLNVRVFRAWQLNEYAEAQFFISTNDSKCTEEVLRFGNLLHIQNNDGLPDWTGFIDTPRRWSGRFVEVNAYSAEILFNWRVAKVTGGRYDTVGNIFREILEWANSWGGLQINQGDIFSGGPHVIMVFGGMISEMLKKYPTKWGHDWSITGRENSGRLYLYANLYDGLRGRVTNFELNSTNTELSDPLLAENGPIYNQVFVYSDPGPGGGRNFNEAMDEDSIAKYGLRQVAELGKGSDTDGLGFQAWVKLLSYRNPRNYITPAILNVANAWNNVRLGNVVRWMSSRHGFGRNSAGADMDARIEGFEFDEEKQKVNIIANAYYAIDDKRQLLDKWLRRNE